MKSGGSPVPWRWLCGSSSVPKAAVLTAPSQHCCKCWAKQSRGRNWLQRTAGTGKGWQGGMAPPLCPLIICLAHLIPLGSSLKADAASLPETGLICSSQGRRTEAKPSLCALSGSIKFVLVSLYHILYPRVTEHPFCKLHYNVSSSAQPCLVQWGLI